LIERSNNGTDKPRTFAHGRFDGALNHLNVSRVTTFREAFYGAEDFRGPLDLWRPPREPNMDRMFRGMRLFHEFEPSLWWYGRANSYMNGERVLSACSLLVFVGDTRPSHVITPRRRNGELAASRSVRA
jgi:hypothetical protein